MMDQPLHIAMLVIGWGIHLLGTLAEESKAAGQVVTIKQYHYKAPYQVLLSVFTSLACYFLFSSIDQLNTVNAFMAGYVGDSAIKKLTNTTRKTSA